MSNSLRPHGLQHTRLPCPSLSPGVCSNLSINSVIPSNRLILCCSLLNLSQHKNLFQWVSSHCGMELLQGPQSHSIPTSQNNDPGPGEGGGRENIHTITASWSASASRKVSPSKKEQLAKESRWRRNRTGRSLSLLQIHQKNNRTVNKVYKTTSDR